MLASARRRALTAALLAALAAFAAGFALEALRRGAPSAPAPSSGAAVVYLLGGAPYDRECLARSLGRLHESYLRRFPAPVVVFHEGLPQGAAEGIRAAALGSSHLVELVQLERGTFGAPPGVDARLCWPPPTEGLAAQRAGGQRGEQVAPDGIDAADADPKRCGYNAMISFFLADALEHPRLRSLRYVMRLDTDSYLETAVAADVFGFMERSGVRYAFRAFGEELEEVAARGMWAWAAELAGGLADAGSGGSDGGRRPFVLATGGADAMGDAGATVPTYYNNLEVLDVQRFRAADCRAFVRAAAATGGVWHRRWGDAPLRLLQTNLLLAPGEIAQLHSFEYVHSLGTRFYASRHCSATNASLGGKFPQYAFPGAARAAELAGGRRDFQCSPPDGP